VIFIPDYNVSLAEKVIPAADLSQHISLAGTEASGTGNMKFTMNGGLIIGTLDGANIEIKEEIGSENIFIFGKTVEEVPAAINLMQSSSYYIPYDLLQVIKMIQSGYFGDPVIFQPIIDSIVHHNDTYLVCGDFLDYCRAQNEVDIAYRDKTRWTQKSIRCSLRSFKFSSDRSIVEYAESIW